MRKRAPIKRRYFEASNSRMPVLRVFADTTETLLRGCKLEGLHPLLIVTYKEYTISVSTQALLYFSIATAIIGDGEIVRRKLGDFNPLTG